MQIAYNTISDWFVFFMRAKVVNYFMPCKFSFEFRFEYAWAFQPKPTRPNRKKFIFNDLCL